MTKQISVIAAMTVVILIIAGCVDGPELSDSVDTRTDHVVTLAADTFDSLVVNRSGKAVIEFYSIGCKACQAMAPIYDSIGKYYGDSLLIGKVNADEEDSLCDRYSINVVPSFVFFSEGTALRVDNMIADETAFDTLSDKIQSLLDGTLPPSSIDSGKNEDTLPPGYIVLDSLSFDTTVLREGRVAMVFFMVPAGLPCIEMDSVVSEMAPQFEGRAVIAKVIVVWGVEPITIRYGINSVPRFLFFKDGVEITEEQRLGIYEGDTLAAVLERLLQE